MKDELQKKIEEGKGNLISSGCLQVITSSVSGFIVGAVIGTMIVFLFSGVNFDCSPGSEGSIICFVLGMVGLVPGGIIGLIIGFIVGLNRRR